MKRVLVKATLPKPLPVVIAWVGEVVHCEWKCPRSLGEYLWLRGFGPGPHITHTHSTVRLHDSFSARLVCNRCVSSCVTEQPARESMNLIGSSIKRSYVFDVRLTMVCPDTKSMHVQEKINTIFGTNDGFFFCVTKLFIGPRAFLGVVTKFFNNFTNARVLTPANESFGPDTHLA